MITLYELRPSPPCRTVRMAAKLFNVDLKIQTIKIVQNEHLTESFVRMNPFHTVPTIDDDGFYLGESRAIMLYLFNKYCPDSPLYPKDIKKRALVDQMFHIDSSILYPRAVGIMLPLVVKGEDPPAEAVENARESLSILNNVLAERQFAAGDDLTLADLSISTTLTLYEMCDYDIREFTNITKYVSRVRSKISRIYAEVNDGPVKSLRAITREKLKRR